MGECVVALLYVGDRMEWRIIDKGISTSSNENLKDVGCCYAEFLGIAFMGRKVISFEFETGQIFLL